MTRRASVAAPSEPVSITITLPFTPQTKQSPNRNTPPRTLKRWRAKDKAMAETAFRAWRNNAGHFGDDPIFTSKVTLFVTVLWGRGRNFWDPDNLGSALKGACDGLKAASIIVDDGPKFLEWAPIQQGRDPERVGCIEFRLTAIQEGERAA